jgi:flagellar biosynthetic protein FliO
MLEQTAAVFLVLALLLGALWLLKRKGFARVNVKVLNRVRSPHQLEIVEQMPLTPTHSLHLVRLQDQLILVGVSPGSCSTLHMVAAEKRASQAGSL